MRAWWTSLTARERTLIALAGGVVIALAFVQFAVVPLDRARARAQASHDAALEMLAEVRAGVAGVDPAREADAPASVGASLRAGLTSSATRRGLSVARVQPLDGGGLSLRFEDADPALLFDWLSSAREEMGARVRQATLRRNEGRGSVQATLVFEEAGS